MTDTELNTNRKLRARVAELEAKAEMDYAMIAGDNAIIAGLKDELAALKTSQQAAREAGQGEPVAWLHQHLPHSDTVGKSLHFTSKSPHGNAVRVTSLYTKAPTIPAEWDEKRMDIIGQNGNSGDHYAEDRN